MEIMYFYSDEHNTNQSINHSRTSVNESVSWTNSSLPSDVASPGPWHVAGVAVYSFLHFFSHISALLAAASAFAQHPMPRTTHTQTFHYSMLIKTVGLKILTFRKELILSGC